MKKIFTGLVLLNLIGLLIMPLLANAVVGPDPLAGRPNECCQLKHLISPIGGDAASVPAKGAIVGNAGGTCYLGGAAATIVGTPNWAAYCTIDGVITFSDWVFWIAFMMAGFIIVIGGIMFMTAGGSPEKTTKAKQILTFAIIGVLIAILAKFIPALARFFVGV